MKAIEGGDAQTIIDHLILEAKKDSQFSFRVRLNEQSHISVLF